MIPHPEKPTEPTQEKTKMKAAVYARYSSATQWDTSAEDQLHLCVEEATRLGFEVDPDHHFVDRARSGRRIRRDGLDALLAAAEAGEFEVAFVEKLGRLGRNTAGSSKTLEDLRVRRVRLIAVTDRFDSSEESDWLKGGVLQLTNEAYSREVAHYVKRGQRAARRKGYMCGDVPYGFKSVPSEKVKRNRRGELTPEGYYPVPDPITAPVVVKIFEWADEGVSLNQIAKRLNQEGIPCPRGVEQGWRTNMISKILRNPKYNNCWVWGRFRVTHHGTTDQAIRYERPRQEWDIAQFEGCEIIPKEMFERVGAKLDARAANYTQKGRKGFTNSGSFTKHYPKSLLSGTMRCGLCDGQIGERSGNHGGYFGCLKAATEGCQNQVMVRRLLAERLMVRAIHEVLSVPRLIEDLVRKVFGELKKHRQQNPDQLARTEAELKELRRQLHNFVAAIANGNNTDMLHRTMITTEARVVELEHAVALLGRGHHCPKPPSKEWIKERLEAFQELLERRTGESALVLREVLGEVILHPVLGERGKSFYRAETRLGVVELLEKTPPRGSPHTPPSGPVNPGAPGGAAAQPQPGLTKSSTSFNLLPQSDWNPRPTD